MFVVAPPRRQIAALIGFVVAGCSSKSSNTEGVGSNGSPPDAALASTDASDAASAVMDAGASAANDLGAQLGALDKRGFPDPFVSDPFDAKWLSGTTLRDGKLVDITTLSPKLIFRACPSDVASGSIVGLVVGDPQTRLLEIHLESDLRPKQRVKLFAETATHQHHGPSYATVELMDRTEARKGYVFAHAYGKSRVDIEFDADFGPKGRIKGRFESGPPRKTFGRGVKCRYD